ncbi:FAD-binding domain-containing protein [Sphaerotilus hippei]|nr:FAD-binding domain-containing protein [Sphaerotilus hippei]
MGTLDMGMSVRLESLRHFEPRRDAAWQRLRAVQPAAYARSRNHLDGAATGLSPYITHGVLSLPEVLGAVLAGPGDAARLEVQHKLVYELGWRAYFQHVRARRGEAILQSLHPGLLPDEAYAPQVPDDVRQARTGVPVIDQAVRSLYACGHLHNHARLWLASYLVHLRKVHWRAGADWLIGHLLDGDVASNHLSWQWVAATGSHKPYLFNADNVARFAPPSWHSPGTPLDTDYATLEAVARDRAAMPVVAPTDDGVIEPPCSRRPPPQAGFTALADAPDRLAGDLAGRDVWLVHPWSLGRRPEALPAQAVPVGAVIDELHPQAWRDARWAFVAGLMEELGAARWHGSAADWSAALRTARSVHLVDDLHLGPAVQALLPPGPGAPAWFRHDPPALFAPVSADCASFSKWWAAATRGLQHAAQLPGLAATFCAHAGGPNVDTTLALPFDQVDGPIGSGRATWAADPLTDRPGSRLRHR